MELLVASLAVYKLVQLAESLVTKETMPWVKILFSISLSYAVAALLRVDNLAVVGLTVATLAGTVHAVLRLITLIGDLARRRSTR